MAFLKELKLIGKSLLKPNTFYDLFTIFPCTAAAETSFNLDLKISEFPVFSEFLCIKFGKRGQLFKEEQK